MLVTWDAVPAPERCWAATGLTGSGAVTARYVLAGATVLEQTTTGTTHYLLRDGQGSTRALFDLNSGAISETYLYDAFGGMRAGPTVPQSDYLYTGQRFDSETGLYYLRARFYNPADGRFLSQDTYPVEVGDPTQLNRYTYGANNPVNGFDPSGQLFIERVAIDNQNEKQREDHAQYHAGVDFARGLDAGALRMEAVFSALFDEIFVNTVWQIFLDAERSMGWTDIGPFGINTKLVMGLGTVYHLKSSLKGKPGTITKAVSINADRGTCQWSKLGRRIGCPRQPNYAVYIRNTVVQGLNIAMGVLYPGSNAVGIKGVREGNNYADAAGFPWKKNHAEILIARWAIRNYGGPPTPHRVLDIVTSQGACSQFEPEGMPCELILPALVGIQPLLFEATIFKP